MSFPQSDRFWLDTYRFIKQHIQAQDKIVAPQEFQEKLNNVTNYLLSRHEQAITTFQWLVLHKGRLDELEVDLLKKTERFFKPVKETYPVSSLNQ